MTINECKFETVHDTANRTMTHVVHPRLRITLDFANYEILIAKDGKVVDRRSVKGQHLSFSEYEEILIMAEEATKKLNRFE